MATAQKRLQNRVHVGAHSRNIMATRVDVKAIRDRFGENRETFGKRVSASSRTVRRWENGEVAPSPMALKHLDAIMAESEPPESPRRRSEATQP